jgi:hypothetical protein
MTISKVSGWCSLTISLLGIAFIGFMIAKWTLQDPQIDPLPAAINLLFGPVWWIFLFAGVSFVLSVLTRNLE